MITVTINGRDHRLKAEADMPLLWALRDILGMTGSKFGCGKGLCGACTVHVDGQAMRSCILPVGSLSGRKITTIEGLSDNADHPLQQAWREHNVPQCGYCQSGQLMSAAALLANNAKPTEAEIDQAMGGNICRCGTYPRIKSAIQSAAKQKSMVQSFDPSAHTSTTAQVMS